MASEVIKNIFFILFYFLLLFLWPRFITLHKGKSNISPRGRKTVWTTIIIRASVLVIAVWLYRCMQGFCACRFVKKKKLYKVFFLISFHIWRQKNKLQYFGTMLAFIACKLTWDTYVCGFQQIHVDESAGGRDQCWKRYTWMGWEGASRNRTWLPNE